MVGTYGVPSGNHQLFRFEISLNISYKAPTSTMSVEEIAKNF